MKAASYPSVITLHYYLQNFVLLEYMSVIYWEKRLTFKILHPNLENNDILQR